MSTQVSQFVKMLSEVHKDSRDLLHFARKESSSRERSTMPATAFVYQFFIYNNLYSIDWPSSVKKDEVTFFSQDRREGFKQHQFEAFLRDQAQKKPQALRNAFHSLPKVAVDEPWAAVVPDPYISLEDGKNFFNSINQLHDLIQGPIDNFNLGRSFARIETCRLFVYKVRSNIFHGIKSLGELWDSNQQKRLEVYLQFLRCLISCFFLCYEVAQEG